MDQLIKDNETIHSHYNASSRLQASIQLNFGTPKTQVQNLAAKGWQISLFSELGVTSEGQDIERSFAFSIIMITLGTDLPHLYFDNQHVEPRIKDLLKHSDSDSALIPYPGYTSKTYTLYIQKDYQKQAISIATPTIFDSLLTTPTAVDIEIKGSQLYLITNKELSMKYLYTTLLPAGKKIAQELNKNDTSYIDHHPKK